MNKFILTLVIYTLCIFQTKAQPPGGGRPPGGGMDPSNMTSGVIAGMVLNGEDQSPIEYANVIVNDTAGNLINGVITNGEGRFMIKKVPFGKPATIEISFIGFKSYSQKGIVLTKEAPFSKAGTVVLDPDTELLAEVQVTGERSIVQTSLDKKTYNVEKATITKSKSVSDVLKELPSVTVEADGSISLRGNSNIRILVDGESGLSQSGDIELILQQMPAESVEKIDVITNPSAKYDPEGTSGIINIILKKEKQRGINGTVSAGLGTWNKYNAGTFISYRKNKLGITANYNFRYYKSDRDGKLNNNSIDIDTITLVSYNNILDQISESENDNQSHFARIGFNIKANDKNTISFGGLTSLFWFNRDAINYNSYYDDKKDTTELTENSILFNGNGRFSNANIYHTINLKKEDADVKYGFNFSNFDGNFDGGYIEDSVLNGENQFVDEQETEVDAISYTLDIPADFTIPVNESITEEFGIKSTIIWRTADFISQTRSNRETDFTSDVDLNNDYDYQEQIHAGYFNHIHSIKRFSYQVGLRLEVVNVNAESIATEKIEFDRQYFSYYPSIFLKQRFGKDEKSLHEMQISYSKRVNRPSFRITNPFRDYSDERNPREGNPFLQPEYINSFELGYNKIWEKVTFNTSLFYKLTTDLYTRVTNEIEEGVILTQYKNIGESHDYGWEIINKFEILKWWDINLDFNISQERINGEYTFEGIDTSYIVDVSNKSLKYGGKDYLYHECLERSGDSTDWTI